MGTHRQDQLIKAQRAADVKVAEIIDQAVSDVKQRSRKRKAATAEDLALGARVKELRETGMAWWRIAFELGLPGSGPSVAQGKAGAGRARTLYAMAYGAVPRSQRPKGSVEGNGEVRRLKRERKADRVETARSGKPVLNEDMPDAEVLEMLRGRTIGWSSNMNDIDGQGDHFYEQEAGVSDLAKIEIHNGERCLAFRAVDHNGPIKLRHRPAHIRIVRLRSIHTVR